MLGTSKETSTHLATVFSFHRGFLSVIRHNHKEELVTWARKHTKLESSCFKLYYTDCYYCCCVAQWCPLPPSLLGYILLATAFKQLVNSPPFRFTSLRATSRPVSVSHRENASHLRVTPIEIKMGKGKPTTTGRRRNDSLLVQAGWILSAGWVLGVLMSVVYYRALGAPVAWHEMRVLPWWGNDAALGHNVAMAKAGERYLMQNSGGSLLLTEGGRWKVSEDRLGGIAKSNQLYSLRLYHHLIVYYAYKYTTCTVLLYYCCCFPQTTSIWILSMLL